MTYMIGTVAVAAVIFGITEALKEFGITGKASRLVVFVLGVIFVGLAAANEAALIPADTMQYINLVVVALAGGLSAMGYYDFTKEP
jgi:hypothetical protein